MFRWSKPGSVVCWLAAAALGVCAAQTFPSGSGEAAAKVIALTGQVSVMRDSGAWALNLGDKIQPQQLIVTGPDGFAKFEVSDGSTFEVFPNSKVTFRKNAGDWRDLLDMWIGRVKVHIQKLSGQPNPNNVRTPTAVISVRGTVFDVVVEDEDATTFVMVEEGQVAVRHTLKPGEPKLLNSGEWLRVYKNEPLAHKSVDKGSVLKAVMRAAADAIYNTIYQNPRGAGPAPVPGGGGVPGGGVPGDTKAPAPPPVQNPPAGGDTSAPPPPAAPPQ